MSLPKLTPLFLILLLLLLIIFASKDETRASALSNEYKKKFQKHLGLHQWQQHSTSADALFRASARRVPNSSDPLHNRWTLVFKLVSIFPFIPQDFLVSLFCLVNCGFYFCVLLFVSIAFFVCVCFVSVFFYFCISFFSFGRRRRRARVILLLFLFFFFVLLPFFFSSFWEAMGWDVGVLKGGFFLVSWISTASNGCSGNPFIVSFFRERKRMCSLLFQCFSFDKHLVWEKRKGTKWNAELWVQKYCKRNERMNPCTLRITCFAFLIDFYPVLHLFCVCFEQWVLLLWSLVKLQFIMKFIMIYIYSICFLFFYYNNTWCFFN